MVLGEHGFSLKPELEYSSYAFILNEKMHFKNRILKILFQDFL